MVVLIHREPVGLGFVSVSLYAGIWVCFAMVNFGMWNVLVPLSVERNIPKAIAFAEPAAESAMVILSFVAPKPPYISSFPSTSAALTPVIPAATILFATVSTLSSLATATLVPFIVKLFVPSVGAVTFATVPFTVGQLSAHALLPTSTHVP